MINKTKNKLNNCKKQLT